MIPNKREISIVIVGLVAAFAFGRYSVQSGVNEQSTKTVQSDTEVNEHKDTHVEIKTVTAKAPDGTVTTTTTKDIVTAATKERDVKSTVVESRSTQVQKKSTLNVSALFGVDTRSSAPVVSYGVSVSKEFIGPVTVGLFGLNNGTVGVSLGLNF